MSKGRLILTIVLFTLGWTIMYADRNVLGPVIGTVEQEWGLSKSQLGLLSTAFFLAYAVMQIPTGILADKYGRVKILVTGFLIFGIFVFFSGMANGFIAFLIIRFFTGLGEATYYGSQYAISSNVVPSQYRGVSSAIINSGQALGVSIGLIGASFFTFTVGKNWQFTYTLLAIPAIIIAILIAFLVKDNPISDPVVDDTGQKPSVKVLFSRNHILTYVLIFCSLYGFFGMLTWLPYYLQTVRGLAPSQTGFISSLVPWASIPGALFFGYLSDKLKSKKALIIALAIAGGLCQFMIPYVASFSLMITGLIIYGLLGKLALDPVIISHVGSITPRSMYSKAYSFSNFAGMLSSIFAPYISGYLAEVTGKIEVGFYLSGIILLIGGIAFMFTTKQEVSNDPNNPSPVIPFIQPKIKSK